MGEYLFQRVSRRDNCLSSIEYPTQGTFWDPHHLLGWDPIRIITGLDVLPHHVHAPNESGSETSFKAISKD